MLTSLARPDRDHRPGRLTRTAATALALCLIGSGTATVTAATTQYDPGALETTNTALSRQAGGESMVLLENNNQSMPIAVGNVAVFGPGGYATVKGGTGSGNVNQRATLTQYNVLAGLTAAGFTITTAPAYLDPVKAALDKALAQSSGLIFEPPLDYATYEQALTSTTVQPTTATTTAIYVISRNSGEGSDRSEVEDDYMLNQTERANITLIAQTYANVIIALNVGGQVDTTFFTQINSTTHGPDGSDGLDGLLLMSQAGGSTGQALADVLTGEVNPSGHLVDTWASKYSYYPASDTFALNDDDMATENYTEGIYVGYRYFDSFHTTVDPADPASVVTYPFGFGRSYTTFTITAAEVSLDTDQVKVRAAVTNTGDVAGKQVVQTYYSAPAGSLDKPYQELVGYAKTGELAPGQCQRVTITFPASQMASFDQNASAWMLQAGDYLIRVGDSSRSTAIAGKISLSQQVVTEQLSSQLNDDQTITGEKVSDPANYYSYPEQADQIATAPTLALDPASIPTQNNASAVQQSVTIPQTSPLYALDNSPISAITALVAENTAANWENTGTTYQPREGETVRTVATTPGATLADVARGTITMDQFVASLSVDQLARIASGFGFSGKRPAFSTYAAIGSAGYTAPMETLGIAAMSLADGPAGLRLTKQYDVDGVTHYQWATAWPIGTALAQTWNLPLVEQIGQAMGQEMVEYGVTICLAPGMNIHRDPMNGRNFEYYSEDPLISGLNGASITKGVQSNPGVGTALKHFAMNNQESNSNVENSIASERAEREIYLKGFEIAVKSAQPMAIMSSYNKINGTWASMNYDLLTDILRGEWGFQGFVLTDWGGNHSATASMYSGNDLIEPGDNSSDIAGSIMSVPPSIDVNGMPIDSQTYVPWGDVTIIHAFKLNGFVFLPGGDQTVTTLVDAASIQATPSSIVIDDTHQAVPQPKYASVDQAYQQALAWRNSLPPDQRGAITITPQGTASPVETYTVTLTGRYAGMRLGDLQRAVSHILSVVSHSASFAQLTGVTVEPYTSTFENLTTYLDASVADPAPGCMTCETATACWAPTEPAPQARSSASAPARPRAHTGGRLLDLDQGGWAALIVVLSAATATSAGFLIRRRP
ncbi:MAG: glycoside hydrolase family 3 C-terminal domain-containing protein [Propionibacteriaceae bacterium]|jgi:beta-glucosidase|nr:glycoside hydrolase family 3 C-terminal domain-containing protein [Propionibacteriaceae bacterium]